MELFSSPNRTGSDWSLALFPTLLHADVISRKVKRYAAEEIRGVFLCGIGQQLDYYLWVQTILKADTDYEEVVSEVFINYFGSAAVPMQRFYQRLSTTNQEFSG